MSQRNLESFQSAYIDEQPHARPLKDKSATSMAFRLHDANKHLAYAIGLAENCRHEMPDEERLATADTLADVMARVIINTVRAAAEVGVNVSCDMQLRKMDGDIKGKADWWSPERWKSDEEKAQ